MVKIKQLQIITILMFLFFQGCIAYVPVPVTDSQGGGPPLIAFEGSPVVIVIPDTDDVYVVPDIHVDLFFWSGWWWRPWNGRWYRSQYYNQSWIYYRDIPSFYFDVDPGWRENYRGHHWYEHRWDYERIPNQRLQQNWKRWQNDHHWERQEAWGVRNYQPKPQQQRQELRQQRQHQNQHRQPEVKQPQRQREVQQPQPQRQREVQQPQRQPEVWQRQRRPEIQQPRGKSENQEKGNQERKKDGHTSTRP